MLKTPPIEVIPPFLHPLLRVISLCVFPPKRVERMIEKEGGMVVGLLGVSYGIFCLEDIGNDVS